VNSTRFNLGVWTTALVEAITANNVRRIASLCDAARVAGLNYRDIADIACRSAGLNAAAWDALLYEADTAEGES
jgi:hypothetical protein